MKKIAVIVVVVMYQTVAMADNFSAAYLEGRKVFQGKGGAWMSAYSDLAVYLPVYSSGSEFGLEGQYNVAGPLSMGGKFLSQFPEWSKRDNYLFGPSFQLKLGNSEEWGLFDATVRLVPLLDSEAGELGRTELYLITIFETGRWQIIPAIFAFWTKDFVWKSKSQQKTMQTEFAFQLWQRKLMAVIRPEVTNVQSEDGTGRKVADITVFTISFGLKGEFPVGNGVTLWGQLSFGPQKRSDRDETGTALYLSLGARF